MPLGDNRFDESQRLGQVFVAHSVAVLHTPSEAALNVPRDKFGRPLQASTPATINILLSKTKEDISAVAAGGKPKEVLEFFALPSTVTENDEVTWNSHVFRISSVWPLSLGGATQFLSCQAEREIDL